MLFIQNVLWYLILIGVMIMIHELGHYWAARFFDVRVETFSFGFGPRLFGFKRGRDGFPVLGDPVRRLRQDDGRTDGRKRNVGPRSLNAKPRWQRAIIAFAGPAINVVLAVGLLAGLYMFRYPHVPNPHVPEDRIVGRRWRGGEGWDSCGRSGRADRRCE